MTNVCDLPHQEITQCPIILWQGKMLHMSAAVTSSQIFGINVNPGENWIWNLCKMVMWCLVRLAIQIWAALGITALNSVSIVMSFRCNANVGGHVYVTCWYIRYQTGPNKMTTVMAGHVYVTYWDIFLKGIRVINWRFDSCCKQLGYKCKCNYDILLEWFSNYMFKSLSFQLLYTMCANYFISKYIKI